MYLKQIFHPFHGSYDPVLAVIMQSTQAKASWSFGETILLDLASIYRCKLLCLVNPSFCCHCKLDYFKVELSIGVDLTFCQPVVKELKCERNFLWMKIQQFALFVEESVDKLLNKYCLSKGYTPTVTFLTKRSHLFSLSKRYFNGII